MNAKFTRAPWTACQPGDYGDYDGNSIVVLGDDLRVAVVLGGDEESKANARLIASAPALLEAANAAMQCISELTPTQARVEVAQMLQNAIAKATGE